MATQVQIRRGTTAQHGTFTGAAGELTVDSDKKTVVVHDGTTAGGAPLLRENGSQNAVTTGTSTAGAFIPTSSTVPTNGVYLPSANSVALATAGTGRLFVASDGKVGIGTTSPSFDLTIDKDSNSLVTSYTRSFNTGSSAGGRIIAASAVGSLSLAAYSAAHSTWPNSTALSSDSGFSGGLNIFQAGANPIVFWTNGYERGRWDSSGRLLVGTSTARSVFDNLYAPRLQVEGTDATHGFSVTLNAASTDGSYIHLSKSRSASAGGNAVVSSGDRLGAVVFQGADGAKLVPAARIDAFVDATPGTDDMPGRLVFSTTADGASSPTERMRINNTGFFTNFASADTGAFSTAAAAGTTVAVLSGYYGATANFTAAGTRSFLVWSNGNVANTNNSYGAISDIKLKENIVNANSQWNDLKALQVRNYNFKEGQTHTQIGLIAQEVELVSPGLVSESPDRDAEGNDLGTVTKSVNYSVLYMKAVKALQEAMERIETLEARVAALEGA